MSDNCPVCGIDLLAYGFTRCDPKPIQTTTTDPIDIAHQWLKKQREECCGPIKTWDAGTQDTYYRDLGLLVDFATDVWPKKEENETKSV